MLTVKLSLILHWDDITRNRLMIAVILLLVTSGVPVANLSCHRSLQYDLRHHKFGNYGKSARAQFCTLTVTPLIIRKKVSLNHCNQMSI